MILGQGLFLMKPDGLLNIKDLPVTEHRDAILKLYEKHKVLLIIGETGSGKTTQIPKFIYEHLKEKTVSSSARDRAMIAITQPRRVAAMSLAKRVAEETDTRLGTLVGYNVRFDEMSSAQTRIKFFTDGMLLREVLSDPTLSKYSTIILDEAHERTLRTDILFGIVKRIQQHASSKLKIVIMSATLNADKFLEYFEDAVLYRVPGRQFPVRMFYTAEPQQDYLDATVLSIFQLHLEKPPTEDILVFLTGQEEIEAVSRILEEHAESCPSGTAIMKICPIYASLPTAQQMAVFTPTPPNARKIILATNIAETSITIPGIKYVIDPGMVKMRLFSPRSGIETLVVKPISKSAARQRCGRAGREQNGECYRLFTEDAWKTLEDETPPEILRTNLSTVILTIKAAGIDDVVGFEYIDAPPIDSLKKGLEELLFLGGLDRSGTLTTEGRLMAECPLAPTLSKVLFESCKLHCSDEVITILAMLSAENIFHSSSLEREAAGMAKKAFSHRSGDHMMLLSVYKGFISSKGDARWCRDNFIDTRAMKMATNVRAQLVQFCERNKLPIVTAITDPANILKAFTAGFFMQCAYKQPDGTFKTLVGRQTVHIHPSSILHGQRPDCVVYNELTMTSKCYLRTVSIVEPSWVSEYSKALR